MVLYLLLIHYIYINVHTYIYMFEYTLLNDNISNDDTFYFRLQEDRVDLVKVDVTDLKNLSMEKGLANQFPATISMDRGKEIDSPMYGDLDNSDVNTLVSTLSVPTNYESMIIPFLRNPIFFF